MSDLNKIKTLMIDALEEPDDKNILHGEFVCHEDIPEHNLFGADKHFTVVGEDEEVVYSVMIHKLKI
jgi:hypothetical protein